MENNDDPVAVPVPPRPSYPPPALPPGYGQPSGPAVKSPLLAAFFSFLMPGLGHVYVGLYQRALIVFGVWLAFFASSIHAKDTETGMLVPIIAFVWLFNVFDAYRQATFAVWGEPEEIQAATRSRGKNGLAIGIALFGVGLYGLVRKYFEIDLSFLLDHWYLVVMAVGGWLIWQAIAAGKAAEARVE